MLVGTSKTILRMKKEALKKIARDRGLEVPSSVVKATLVAILIRNQGGEFVREGDVLRKVEQDPEAEKQAIASVRKASITSLLIL